jgi:hypothetical protein
MSGADTLAAVGSATDAVTVYPLVVVSPELELPHETAPNSKKQKKTPNNLFILHPLS